MLQLVLYCGTWQEKNNLCLIEQHVHATQLSLHWLKETVLKDFKSLVYFTKNKLIKCNL
jgi:hypothetical protein